MAKQQFPGWPSRDLVSPLPDGVEPIQYVEEEEAPAPSEQETPPTPPSEGDGDGQ
jgi:hypothetical protein